ncbi:reverse transcriptase domain-containing protein [Tanacetum coccineum]
MDLPRLADLGKGTSINLKPLFYWKKLSLPEASPTESDDFRVSRPNQLHILIDSPKTLLSKSWEISFSNQTLIVVRFRSVIHEYLSNLTGRALIDVYGEEITLQVDKSVNRIDIIDAVCEEYAPEFLGFPNSSGGNPTPTSEPFTFEFILEEIQAYLKDDSISPEIDHADFNPEEDICLIKKLLNNDPFQLPPMDLKQSEVTEAKSSIEEPPELELKYLPSHLEYAFLEENEKLPVIIAKGLKNDEKDALLKTMEVFMDDFSVFGDSFDSCLSNLEKMLKRCEDTNLVLNWEKCHFMCREGIVLGHKISKAGIEVDRAKVDVIAKLPHPTIVKEVPMTHLLEKGDERREGIQPFVFSKDCIDAFQTLKKKLTEAPILVVPDWNLPFELMCDASDFAIGAVLGQRKMKHFQPIHYASKTMTEAQIHYN